MDIDHITSSLMTVHYRLCVECRCSVDQAETNMIAAPPQTTFMLLPHDNSMSNCVNLLAAFPCGLCYQGERGLFKNLTLGVFG